MLKCETNTPAIEKKIITAAKKFFKGQKGVNAVFEHGQWWIMFYNEEDEQKIYSVNDAEGIGTINGFDFEEVQ